VHPLHEVLISAAEGRFPPIDGGVEVLPCEPGGACCVVEPTGHSFVLTDRSIDELLARGADGFGGASKPDVVRFLAGPDGWIGSHDAVLVARGTGEPATKGFTTALSARGDLDDHPRVERSRRHRRDVKVFGDDAGFVTLGRGLVGRLEISVELLEPSNHGRGAGRRLIRAGLDLVPADSLVWGQVAPGNAASLRAFLACGFVPIGAETLIL
jgi:RimJ/RimL family protein N-acetyltransferase